jgi:DNA-binding HxlR family transcriptional regulator
MRIAVSQDRLPDAGRPRTIDDLLELCRGRRRARILFALLDGPQDVSALARELGLMVALVSQNLRPLRETGLVGRRRFKKQCVYSLSAAVGVVRSGGRIGLELVAADQSSVVLWEREQGRAARSTARPAAAVRARTGGAR